MSGRAYTLVVTLTFENPAWLALIAVAVPLAWVGLRWFSGMSRARKWSAVVLRTTLVGLIAAMLAGAASVRTSDKLAVLVVVDVSDSVRDFVRFEDGRGERVAATVAMRQWIERAAAEAGSDDLVGVVVFDGSSMAVSTAQAGWGSGENAPEISLDYVKAEGTDIGGALRFARALFPPGAARRIVLISDGNETEGDAVEAATEIAAQGVPIDVVPLGYRVENEVLVEAVDVPPQSAKGSTVAVRVVLRSTEATTGRLDLLYEGEPLDINGDAAGTSRRVELAGGRHVERITVELSEGTVHRFEPVFVPDDPGADQLASNNSGRAFTVSPGRGSVLIVDGVSDGERGGEGRILESALRGAGIDVERVGPNRMPRDLLALNRHDMVILQNVAVEEIPLSAHEVLVDYVEGFGGGLVMVGGPDSFGAGGWHGTALEEILPVRLDLPEQMISSSAAIVLVLDSSGSMGRAVLGGSRSQQQIANEGAALAVQTLDQSDKVGVIDFDDSTNVVVPLARNSDPQQTAERIRGISPGGGTAMYPAMRTASEMLRSSDAKTRHMIVLSDGQSSGKPEDGLAIAEEMSREGITVSTIAIGDDADVDTMFRIADTGGGQFYHVNDPNVLPRVFVKDVRVVRKPLIRESAFTPVDLGSGSAMVSGIAGWPELRGLVLTRPRESADVTYALATPEGEPVLAGWVVGRGRVVAFTSDASRWAREWIDWSGFREMWAQIVRVNARPSGARSPELTTQLDGDTVRIRLDARDDAGAPIDLLDIGGTVYRPDGQRVEIALEQTGPGVYEASAPARSEGNYVVALFPGGGLGAVLGGVSKSTGPEHRRLHSNQALLQRISEAAGGRVLAMDDPEGAGLFVRDNVEPREASSPLWPILIVWTMGVMLLDVGTRRIAWDRLLSKQTFEEMQEQARASVARGRSATGTLTRLKEIRGGSGEHVEQASGAGQRLVREAAARVKQEARASGAGEREEKGDEGESGGASGLLAAKRRARARFGGESGDASGPGR